MYCDTVKTVILLLLDNTQTTILDRLTKSFLYCVFQLSDIPVLYMYCDTVKTLVPLRFDDPQKTNLDRLTKACIKILTRAQTENMVRNMVHLIWPFSNHQEKMSVK